MGNRHISHSIASVLLIGDLIMLDRIWQRILVLLIGKRVIVANCEIEGTLYIPKGKALIFGCVFVGPRAVAE